MKSNIDYMTEETLQRAEAALAWADPILGTLIQTQQLTISEPRSDYFSSLARSIIGQQVSVAAARTIARRFAEQTNMEPLKAANLSDEQIKTIGLSRQKAGYIRDLAKHFVGNPSVYNHLESMDDESVISELTAVKGIGVWTAQMFLISTLGRLDVFAPDDVGLQRGMLQLYGWDALPPKKELVVIAENWRPYRTIASLHLWHSLDNTPTT